ncbi:hypothetical protein AtNW77_Chr3g0163811 [Arabidopsis thaliana]|uniref:Uncharacterized protein n=3 Tax=Arabidopsis TaxID=3701 RepID=A0A5S9XA77_ARATH|nr:hypothetical protein ISN45_At03g008170 [Arabidopsis thaliana x Arabidopsis arenosa]KAG7630499.1 hypothetical protein ISN44_As03g008260 [Arabidopsis suecica]CAA0381748.1 unnamed protein product [Arabidopsis thaliana]
MLLSESYYIKKSTMVVGQLNMLCWCLGEVVECYGHVGAQKQLKFRTWEMGRLILIVCKN